MNKLKPLAYVINFDGYKSIGTHWIALYVSRDYVTFFRSFKVEHIPKDTKKFIRKKDITSNIYRLQSNDSITCGDSTIEFTVSSSKKVAVC